MKNFLSKPTQHFLLFVTLIITLWLLGRALNIDLVEVRLWLSQYPLWLSGSLFVLIYVGLTTVLWIGTIDFFRISAALLFGPYWSTLFVYTAEIANASILFLLSRKMGRQFVEERFHWQSQDAKYAPKNAGFWTAFVLRINPLVPFRFMDVGFGLTKMPFRVYFYAVICGSLLRIFWLQYVIAGMGQAVLKNPEAMMEYFRDNVIALVVSWVYFLIVIIFTVGVVVNKFIKKGKAPHGV